MTFLVWSALTSPIGTVLVALGFAIGLGMTGGFALDAFKQRDWFTFASSILAVLMFALSLPF